MSSNIFARYIWLVDLLRRKKRLTFAQISNSWAESGLGYGEPLPLRTFHNHRKAIEDIFDINILCDVADDYKYYIQDSQDLANDTLKSWFIDSFATLNQVQADAKLKGRIIYEDIPSGALWLTVIVDAMKQNRVLEITYQSFKKDTANTFVLEPYCVKVVNRRWYVIARNPHYKAVRIYALDRIKDLKIGDTPFVMDEDFSPDTYFDEYFGVMTDDMMPLETILVKVCGQSRRYLETLPLHHSQRLIKEVNDEDYSIFQYRLRPTYDFYQSLFSFIDSVEVISPDSVRAQVIAHAHKLLSRYRANVSNSD
jgi:hypothetical protein